MAVSFWLPVSERVPWERFTKALGGNRYPRPGEHLQGAMGSRAGVKQTLGTQISVSVNKALFLEGSLIFSRAIYGGKYGLVYSCVEACNQTMIFNISGFNVTSGFKSLGCEHLETDSREWLYWSFWTVSRCHRLLAWSRDGERTICEFLPD